MALAPPAEAKASAFGAAPVSPRGDAAKINPAGTFVARGLDRRDHTLFVEDLQNDALRESSDWGVTFSANKGLPPGVPHIAKILRFKSHLYAIGKDAASGRAGVYRAIPTPGSEPLRWIGPSLTIQPTAGIGGPNFNANGRYLYVGEYGLPRPGPRVFRSADGITWRKVFGPAPRLTHIHAVNPDPYHPGDVWMTVGDGVQAVYRSRRYGAPGSWHVVLGSSAWQSVQISFDRTRIYLAADTHSETFFVIDRRSLRPRIGTPTYFAARHPPGSPRGTRYLFNAFLGAVDPRTGIYYCVANDDSEGAANPTGWQGLFAVRRVGGPLSVLYPGGRAIGMNGEVFIGGGRVFSGVWWATALSNKS